MGRLKIGADAHWSSGHDVIVVNPQRGERKASSPYITAAMIFANSSAPRPSCGSYIRLHDQTMVSVPALTESASIGHFRLAQSIFL
jgi:hypothetical protein